MLVHIRWYVNVFLLGPGALANILVRQRSFGLWDIRRPIRWLRANSGIDSIFPNRTEWRSSFSYADLAGPTVADRQDMCISQRFDHGERVEHLGGKHVQ
jgi:hypothetical protein